MDKIRILLVDDQMLFVESLKTVLETRAQDITVVGVASNGAQALELVGVLHPDMVLMDVRMPVMNGVESTRLIKEQFPETKVLMLTTFDDDQYVVEALRFGAVGYLLKDMPPAELISAVRAIHEGGVLISPKVASKIVEKLTSPGEKEPGNNGGPLGAASVGANASAEGVPSIGGVPSVGGGENSAWVNDLSNREKKILQLMAQGLDNKEIAKALFIAEQTVKNHVSIIYSKLGVRDRVQASRLVIEAGLDKDQSEG
ncbi:MAG TPA: response regulator transcription factor [Bacillota bacterium]|nr:response regulator transcription factor [Bacillota bacterium]